MFVQGMSISGDIYMYTTQCTHVRSWPHIVSSVSQTDVKPSQQRSEVDPKGVQGLAPRPLFENLSFSCGKLTKNGKQ